MSLGQAIQQALGHNRTLEAERKNLEVAHGIVIETRAILLPQLKLEGRYESFDAHLAGPNPFGLTVPERMWASGVQLSQSIYEGGRMRSALRTAKWTRERAIFQYDKTLSDVLLKVRLAYQEALLAQAQLHFIQAFKQIQQTQLGQISDKVRAGSMTKLELAQAEVEVANFDAKLISTTNQVRLALIRLLDVLGLDASDSAVASLHLTDTLTLEPLSLEMPVAIQRALANRADLKAFERTVLLRGEDVTAAGAWYKPSVQLVGGYGGMNDSIGRDLYGWYGGVQATWVWFDGLKSQGRSEQVRAGHARNRIELEDLKKGIDVEVRTAYFSVIEARERHSALQKALDSANEALRQARAQLEVGGATRFDVLRSERAKEDIQVSQLEALYAYNVALARLDHAIGGVPDAKEAKTGAGGK